MKYEINDIERLTGIKAHTIRIWEKRYDIVKPHRTDTNIRYYDDSQAKKLLNVCALVNAGKKISRIARMTEKDLEAEVYLLQISGSEQQVSASLILQLTTAMLDFDQNKFEQLLNHIFQQYGALDGMTKIIYPFLENVGVLWSTNDTMPAQEHFASCLIREKIITETAKLPAKRHKDKLALLFLPPQEYHEIGLLLTNYLVRSLGISTIYLGAAVPFENTLISVGRLNPTHLISFFIMHKRKMDLPAEFSALARKIGDKSLIVCGRSEMLAEIPQRNNLVTINDIQALRDKLMEN